MHTVIAKDTKSTSWQAILQNSITEPSVLLQMLKLDPKLLPAANAANQLFQMRVPLPYISRMAKSDPNDPLLQQILPIRQELQTFPKFSNDPLGESSYNINSGIIHKYKNRVLLLVGSTCAINCRFCFRRHFPYTDNKMNRETWQHVLEYIRRDKNISEVIYSGGDPLAVNDQRLKWLTQSIAEISHVQLLRIHTRLPVVIPQRVTNELIEWLTMTRLKPIVVLHFNHPNEIDDHVALSIKKLKDANITLLNQSVLLKSINDNVPALKKLSEKLFHHGVMPYYLHLLDRTQGTAHFEQNLITARQLMAKLGAECSGYLVPRLVRENAGAPSKTLISPLYSK